MAGVLCEDCNGYFQTSKHLCGAKLKDTATAVLDRQEAQAIEECMKVWAPKSEPITCMDCDDNPDDDGYCSDACRLEGARLVIQMLCKKLLNKKD